MKRIGFPWSHEMVERSRRSAGATHRHLPAALEDVQPTSPAAPYHAHADRGEGFCVFNDAAVAARAMQTEGRVRRVVVIDCDVHQGNGTASILQGDDSTFTFSIHGARNFPFDKAKSDLDIELPDGTGDEDYLSALAAGLEQSLHDSRPQLVVYLAGADPYAGDRLGRLSLSMPGLVARDTMVFNACRARGILIAIAMAGGYAEPIEDTVTIHAATILAAQAYI